MNSPPDIYPISGPTFRPHLHSNYFPIVNRLVRNDSIDRYYVLHLDPISVDIDKINELIEEYNPEYITYSCEVDGVTMSAFYNDNIRTVMPHNPVAFKNHESDEIIFPENTEKYGYRPTEVMIAGNKYSVFDWTTFGEQAVISCKGYIESGLATDRIEIYLTRTLTHDRSESMISGLNEILPIEGLSSPEIYKDDTMKSNSIIMICLLIGFCCVMLIFGFLVKYITREERRNNLILLLVGAERSEMTLVIIMEQLFLNLGFSIIAALLHKILFSTLLDSLNLYSGVSMSLANYLLVIALTTLAAFLVTTPYLISASREKMISYRRG